MGHLDQMFRESLIANVADDGKVHIAGNEWTPDQILEIDAPAFEEAFVEWKDDRERQLCQRADEILALSQANTNNFAALKDVFKQGMVTPFIGAGLCIPSGYPSWTAFLYQALADSTATKPQLDALVSDGQFEEAAALLEAHMTHDSFDMTIENTFGISNDINGVILNFPRFFRGSVITTNFDNVTKRVYAESGQPFTETLIGTSAEDLPRHIGLNERVIVMMHGKAYSRRGRVLTASEYERAYPDNGAIQHVIEAICRQTLLFVGCSLTVDRTLKAMADFKARMANQGICRHYAFLPTINTFDTVQDNETERVRRQQELAASNIIPIWYDGEHDESIEALLLKLEA